MSLRRGSSVIVGGAFERLFGPEGREFEHANLKKFKCPRGVAGGGGDVELSKFSAHNQQHFSDFGLEWIYVPSTKDICIGG